MGQYTPADARGNARYPLRLDVAVYNDSRLPPLHFTTRDISLGGMGLDTGAIALPLNAYVVVVIRAGKAGRSERVDFRRAALVVRTFKDGAGLMFQDYEPQTLHALEEMLSREGVGAPRAKPDSRTWLF